jgi:excisionase family DNA binding protein
MTKWVTLEEATEYVKMGKSSSYKRIRKNRIPAHNTGREWRFDAGELDLWLKADKTVVESHRT